MEYDPALIPYKDLLKTFWQYQDASVVAKRHYLLEYSKIKIIAYQRTVIETYLALRRGRKTEQQDTKSGIQEIHTASESSFYQLTFRINYPILIVYLPS